MEKYYIAYERGGAIWGTGTSADDALYNSEYWEFEHVTLFTTECTKDLYEAVNDYGGDLYYEITYDSPPARLALRNKVPRNRFTFVEEFHDKLYK